MADLNESYCGDYTKAAHVTIHQIEHDSISSVPEHLYTNGFVLEICGYATKKSWSQTKTFQALYNARPDDRMLSVKEDNLRPVINYLKKDKKRYKKGTPKYVALLSGVFKLCRGVSSQPAQPANNAGYALIPDNNTHPRTPTSSVPSTSRDSTHMPVSLQIKEKNILEYDISKKEKYLNALKEKTNMEKVHLNEIAEKRCHYAVRNVNKRDARGKKSMVELKEMQKAYKLKEVELCELRQELDEELSASKLENDKLKMKVITEQKAKSKAKTSLRHEREARPVEMETMRSKISKQSEYIKFLENEVEQARRKASEESISLHDQHGYSIDMRMCVNNLCALQVSQEKIPEVIETVARDIFHKDIPASELPHRKTIQHINDEGHYIAKRFIASQLKQSEGWGINKDGTTRKKQKLLDTTLTLSSGDVMSLGFKRVAKEDAITIAAVTKEHLNELATISSGENADEYMESVLENLTFFMSDRAANEKKSNKLLENWRTEFLSSCGSDKAGKTIHHMYCMAHVLLAFHKDVSEHLNRIQKEQENKLGRDLNEKFRFFKPEYVGTRVARIASDLFGPIGDHLGVRDVWEADCAKNGIKSKIGSYKDNRFNCLFETSAQVVHHKQAFQRILNSVLQKNPKANLKIHSLRADLECSQVMTIIEAQAIAFLRVTGPFWVAMQDPDITYLNLHAFVQPLIKYLRDCSTNPLLMLEDTPAFLRQHRDPSWVVYNELDGLKERSTPLLIQCLSAIASSLVKSMERQLVDFLPGGIYSQPASEYDQKTTAFAPKTNLACEHHFGDLDSSQRRRPNCSLHHHSTVQLLKRNNKAIRKWYMDMREEERKQLWADAKRNGGILRAQHKMQEKKELEKISASMDESAKVSKKRKLEMAETPQQSKRARLEMDLIARMPALTVFCEKQWIIVAYQDNWYPGIILEVQVPDDTSDTDSEILTRVDFMGRASGKGAARFKAPNGKDIQLVDPEFIIYADFVPTSLARGRWFSIPDDDYIEETYELFKSVHF